MEEEHDGIERNEERVSRQFNCLKSQLGCFRIVKNILFYSVFGCNRTIETIDGYDEMVHRGPFRLSRDRRIVMDGHDLIR